MTLRRRLGSFAGLVAAASLMIGCGLIPRGVVAPTPEVPLPYPAGCAAFELSPRRCQAILDWVVVQTGSSGRALTAVELLGDPGCGFSDPNVLCKGGAFVVRMRLRFADGGSAEQSVGCGGVGGQYSILCTNTPEIRVGSLMNGYRDLPCAGEDGQGCATPLPTLEPAAIAAARPLKVARLDVPIDHTGHYEIEAGRASLPNGVLSRAEFFLVDKRTQAISVTNSGINLFVRPADPTGKPFDNYYSHGWQPGTEEVVAVLVFDVTRFDPGALLQVMSLAIE